MDIITKRLNDMRLNKRSSEVDFMEHHQLNSWVFAGISDVTSKFPYVSLVGDHHALQVLEQPRSRDVTPLHINKPDFSENLGEAILREIEADPVMFEEYKQFMESAEDCPKSLLGYRVPISNEEELDVWRKFQELHKRKVAEEPGVISIIEDQMLIDPDQPIIPLLVKFAVETFNEICAKADVSEGVHAIDIFDVKYLGGPKFYVFYITLDTESGPYLARVVIYPDDTKTLSEVRRPPSETMKAVKEKFKKPAESEEILKQSCEAGKGKKKFEKAEMEEISDLMKQISKAVKSSERWKQISKALKGKKYGKRTDLTGKKKTVGSLTGKKKKNTVGALSKESIEHAKKRLIFLFEKKAKEEAQAMKVPSRGSGLYRDIVHGGYSYTSPSAEDMEDFWF